MAQYVYEGPGPVEDDGLIVRPGDVRDFGAEPDWGPWRLLDEGEPESPPPVKTPEPPAAGPPATAAGSTPPPAQTGE